MTIPTEYPCTVEDRYIMNPSPIPKFDNPKLHQSECLYLFGAGREKKIYAVSPHTDVVSLAFEDMPFEREDFKGKNAVSAAAPTLIWMKCSMQRPEKNFISVQILLTARRCVPVKCEEKPVLQVQHLTVRYGEGCPHCQTHLEMMFR